ncbi:MAG: GspH/FimT family pseudopilin [Comamonas sp.]|nr:GspH/FimT family pseudopilin [Comamonas sp.]
MTTLLLSVLSIMRPTSNTPIHGFTLTEALVVLAILSILLSLAAPALRNLHRTWQVRQTVSAMESTLMLGRSTAIRHGGNVVLYKASNTNQGCQNASLKQEWGCGWFLFHDLNGSGTWTKTEPKLHEVLLDGSVNAMHTSGGAAIKFNRFGMVSGLNAKGMTFSPAGNDPDDGVNSPAMRTLCMATGGRIRIIEDASCPQ